MTLTSPSDVWFGTDESPPADGNLLVLNYHHDGESHWCSPEQVRERLVEIRTVKPKAERPARLAAMGVIPFGPWWKENAKAWSEYKATCVKAWSEYVAIRDKAWLEYRATCVKAWSEYRATCVKAGSKLLCKFPKPIPVLEWEAEK